MTWSFADAKWPSMSPCSPHFFTNPRGLHAICAHSKSAMQISPAQAPARAPQQHEVARLLREIGKLLKLKGENRFRAQAYETGARTLEELREDLGTLIAEKRLTELPGIGPALASVITELWTTGRSAQLEHLQKELPKGA